MSPHAEPLPVVEPAAAAPLDFAGVYDAHFPFVWRSARRLGVAPASLDDVVQDVFLVVHRRLDSFEGRSTLKTWIFGIALRVVRDHRRTLRRKPTDGDDGLEIHADPRANPAEAVERAEGVRLLHAILDGLDDEKREVFVMAELEQLTAPEIAEVCGINVNTIYARLRSARKEFDEAVARHQARERFVRPSKASSSGEGGAS